MALLTLKAHPADRLTPVERAFALAHGERYDRLPVSLFVGEIKALLYGVTMDKLVDSVEDIVNAEVHCFNTYGADGISSGPNSFGIARAMGADVVFPPDSIPHTVSDVLTTYEKLDDLGTFDPATTWPVCNRYESCGILSEQAEGLVGVSASVGGPLTIASYLRGVTNLLKDMRRDKENVKRLLEVVVANQKRCIDAFSRFGVTISLGDPVASGSLLSPKYFREFAMPALREVSDYAFEKTGKKPTLHICGRTERVWEDIKTLNLASYSLDNESSLLDAAKFFGDKMALVGNVPPVDVMYEGDREAIFASVKENFAAGIHAKKGYVLAFGCDIPPLAPPENLQHFMDAARYYGAYERIQVLKETGVFPDA